MMNKTDLIGKSVTLLMNKNSGYILDDNEDYRFRHGIVVSYDETGIFLQNDPKEVDEDSGEILYNFVPWVNISAITFFSKEKEPFFNEGGV